jgi:PAS domain S-box-containing protein
MLIAWHNSVLKDKEGKVVASLSSGQDITEQKKTESELKIEREALSESEAKLSSIVENSSDQIFMLDESLTYLSVNKTLGDILGKTPQEIIGKSLKEVYPQETASKFSNNIKNVFETGKSMFMEEKMVAQGHELYISTSLNPVQDDTGNVIAVAGIVRDITQRKKAEDAIKFQADLLNQVGQAVIMVDNNRIIRFWNKAAEKLYGWQEEQALGHQITELLGGISPEEADEVSSKLMAGESWSTEANIKNKDGSVVPVILNRTPIFKEDGEFSGAASITTDITLQKRTEVDLNFSLESLSYSLSKIQELNEKLRVVGDLTRHDVRNKLSTVTGYAYLLKKKHANQADIVEGLGRMEQAVKESVKIFDFAKLYEQLGAEALTTIDVEAKIDEAKALFSGQLPKIINECHGLTVQADSFLRQMFYNFIDNTRKYGQKTSIIKMHYQETGHGNLVLIYEDDGVGISAENKLKLFSQGFSTGGSTGFGLFLTKKMIEVYGWKIEENGIPSEGAKFTITIPKLNKNREENYQIVP